MRRTLGALGLVLLARGASAQPRPFVFTVTTTGAAEPWLVHYDTGYAERTAAPFGYDGLEQVVGVQGTAGRGFTFLGRVAIGAGQGTRTMQEAEVLKDLRGSPHGFRVAAGAGVRREWQGDVTLLGRVSLGRAFERSSLFGNLRLEKPLREGRDAVDLITSVGWLHRAGTALQWGAEAIGEDLEGFWEPEEAEGGAKLFVGPSVHWSPPASRLSASFCGGPIVYATRSGRASDAPRPLAATGNGYTVRLSVGYTF